MRLTLPWPRPELSPNARIHWAKLHRYREQYRHSCGWSARSQGAFPVDSSSVEMTITFNPPDRRKRDRDNMIAAFKSGQDGLSDALSVDDSLFVPTYRVGEPVPGGEVIVEFSA